MLEQAGEHWGGGASESDVTREYRTQQQLQAIESGMDPWLARDGINDRLLKMARAAGTSREPARVNIQSIQPPTHSTGGFQPKASDVISSELQQTELAKRTFRCAHAVLLLTHL